MDFIGLLSGGKDSIYSICKLKDDGYRLVGLLYIYCETNSIDSFMFQTVGKELIGVYEECLNVPLFQYPSKCRALNKDLEYLTTENDEVEDLYESIKDALSKISFGAVSSGAIMSKYQKNRVDNVCRRLNLVSLAPLFKMDQRMLLDEMIEYGMDARVVKTASVILNKEALGKDLLYIKKACDLSTFKDINYCGEGGEYETMVVNVRHFVKHVEVLEFEILGHEEEIGKCQNVFFMNIKEFRVVEK